ncbi:MAG: MBL fold metallo-hydrolase [Bacteroides sp.]|nr:MBL fold metallo-hydrolase [Barnesiella sp.]MBD5369480.1 MBL fold metallo-hydrolase [Bacteroides sp.]
MKITRFVFNMFGENSYVVFDPDTLDAAVIDPGMLQPRENEAIAKYIDDKRLTVRHIINTHLHLDHVFGVNFIKEKYGVKLAAGAADEPLLADLNASAAGFGIHSSFDPVTLDVKLKAGERIYLGKEYLEVISVPGHTPGGIALYAPESKVVFTGDSLFEGSVGRTDLPGGDHATLIKSIRENLLTLPDDTMVLPGHGDATTIGREKIANPYLA